MTRIIRDAEKGHASRQAGFTLIELLVVCAIIALISGLILFNHNSLSGQVALQNTAYDMALSIREGQVYGISVVGFTSSQVCAGGAASAVQFPIYGMNFKSAAPAGYILYADLNCNGIYDSGESVRSYAIGGGDSVYSLCATTSTETCNLAELDIDFKRPDPDALISGSTSGSPNPSCLGSGGTCYSSARIVVRDPQGVCSDVNVSATGQIYVTTDPTCTL